MTEKSINAILMEAHKEIAEKYGIALEEVNFHLVNVSGAIRPKWRALYAETRGKLND